VSPDASLVASEQRSWTGCSADYGRIRAERQPRVVKAPDELACAARLVPGLDPELPAAFLVNGAGNFAVGGPEGNNGLCGKKLVVDAYGPRVPIGGGAPSGKDLYKADRGGTTGAAIVQGGRADGRRERVLLHAGLQSV
jgi:hypothetical protein